jgi:large conductance mechanosensitive channel
MSLGRKLESFDPTKKVGSLFEEFKAFAFKGSMVDLAIGIVIGAAFGAIIKSLVDNLIMPLVSLAVPNATSYENLKLILASHKDPDGSVHIDNAINYGKFLADMVNFLIVALVVFLFLKKLMGWLMRSKQQEAAAPPPPTKDQELLTEIRDLLKQRAA